MGTITDEQGKILATVRVEEYSHGRFEGIVLSEEFPDSLLLLLREFESLANDQILPLLDAVEKKLPTINFCLLNVMHAFQKYSFGRERDSFLG